MGRRDRKPKIPVSPLHGEPGGPRLIVLAIGFLTLAVLPHLGHGQLQSVMIFLFFASWRILSIRWRWIPCNRWIVYLFAAVGFSIVAWRYGPPLGRDPGVAFLLVLLGLKCIEFNSRRDLEIVVLLGLFTVVTHFLYADGIDWAVPLILLVVGFVWLLAQFGHAGYRGSALADLRLIGKMMLQALPFVVILFYLFPRLSGSVYLFQSDSDSAQTGLNDTLTMGSISELIQTQGVAFTATFGDDRIPPPDERYWRGGVLWVTDGRQWRRGEFLPFLRGRTDFPDNVAVEHRYRISLSPGRQNWLFTLDYPGQVPDGAELDSDHHMYLRDRNRKQLDYEMTALAGPNPESLDRDARWMALNVGKTRITPRLRALVDEIREGSPTVREMATRVLRKFNREQFVYTLQPPLLDSDAPVDQFLFETRRGFCGHFSSSFAILMRLAGVPARLVTGYLGGEVNQRRNQITVRQSEAHAWVEIHDPVDGWIRVDPTASVAPERVEYPIDYESSMSRDGLVLFRDVNVRGLRRLALELEWFRDSIRANWNRWFTSFDHDRQKELLKSLGLDGLDLRIVSMAAFLGGLGLLTLVSLWLFRNERRPIDPAQRLFRQFQRRLSRQGIRTDATEGPRDYADRAARHLPQHAEVIQAVASEYISLRYAGSGSGNSAGLKRLRRLVGKL